MLRGLAPILTGGLLSAVDAVGHGDAVAIVDSNFPVGACPDRWVSVPITNEAELITALVRHLPLEGEVVVMEHPETEDEGVRELTEILELPVTSLSRQGYYEATKKASLVIRTRDSRLYGNVLLTVGALAPQGDKA